MRPLRSGSCSTMKVKGPSFVSLWSFDCRPWTASTSAPVLSSMALAFCSIQRQTVRSSAARRNVVCCRPVPAKTGCDTARRQSSTANRATFIASSVFGSCRHGPRPFGGVCADVSAVLNARFPTPSSPVATQRFQRDCRESPVGGRPPSEKCPEFDLPERNRQDQFEQKSPLPEDGIGFLAGSRTFNGRVLQLFLRVQEVGESRDCTDRPSPRSVSS